MAKKATSSKRPAGKSSVRASRVQGRTVFKSRLTKGDVVKVLDRLPASVKFDVVIADPPYNIGKDFGNDSDRMPMEDYLSWTDEWLGRCLDRLADNGVAYVYGFAEILARISARYPIDEQRWLVWHYMNKAVPSLKFWQRSHESILCMWKPGHDRPDLEIDQIREPYTNGYKVNIGKVRAGTGSRFSGDRYGRETVYSDHGGALPRDVLKIPALAGGAGASERWFMCRTCGNEVYPPQEMSLHRGCDVMKHPTQKPMELSRRLIRSRISENEGGGWPCSSAVRWFRFGMRGSNRVGRGVAGGRDQSRIRRLCKEVAKAMYRLTPVMEQKFRQFLAEYHRLLDGGRCQSWELEEFMVKAIKADNSKDLSVCWREKGHDDKNDITVSIRNKKHLLQIKSGQIRGKKDNKYINISGYRLGRFDGDFSEISKYLNNRNSEIISIPYRKLENSQGRSHIYRICYIKAEVLQGVSGSKWTKKGKQYIATNSHGVEFSLRPSMSWQVWWKIPYDLLELKKEFTEGQYI